VSRREFLGQGFLTGAAFVAMPTIGSILAAPDQALAAMDCGLGGGAPHVPFICFDLAGGANIAGSNVMVGQREQIGQLAPNDLLTIDGYKKLGLPEEETPIRLGAVATNNELGLLFHRDSAMLRGILNFTTPETRCPLFRMTLTRILSLRT